MRVTPTGDTEVEVEYYTIEDAALAFKARWADTVTNPLLKHSKLRPCCKIVIYHLLCTVEKCNRISLTFSQQLALWRDVTNNNWDHIVCLFFLLPGS